jgi:hypothetical protein
MPIMRRKPSLAAAAGPCCILLGLITLLLFPATARSQSGWGPGLPPPSPPVASGKSRLNPSPPAPLLPASVFGLQTNLRKYLETWPTPGSTATEAWPEYIPEDEGAPD